MRRIGIGLIGVGKHGLRYARHIAANDVPGLRLVAVARRDRAAARAQAAEFGCRAHADYRELLADADVDAVVVVVPPTLHPEIVEAAAAARRPVLLEKPASTSVADGRRMIDSVRRSGIPLMVAQTLRYNGVVRTVLVAREQIGRVHAVRLGQRFEPSRPGWIDDPAVGGGGITLYTGVHSFDLARLFTGVEVDRVSCETAAVATRNTDDNFSAVLRMGGGSVLANVGGSRATASRSGGIEVAGEHGQIVADHILNTASLVRGSSVSPLPVPEPVHTVREILADFARVLSSGSEVPIPLVEGMRAVAIAEACYRSAEQGRAVEVEKV